MPVVTQEDRWAELPPELLHFIARKLPDTGDFVRFRAVCTAWRDGALPSDPPPHLPWALQQRRPGLHERHWLRFYSPSGGGRVYGVRAGGRRSSWLIASGGYQGRVVATVDLSRAMLYNPVTGDVRALPPAPFTPWRGGVFRVLDDPREGCMVINTCRKTRHFAYCRLGADDDDAGAGWTVVGADRADMRHAAYLGGRFFVNTADRRTLVIDAATRAVEAEVPAPAGEDLYRTLFADDDYLVASRGKVLRAIKHGPRVAGLGDMDCRFNIYQLDWCRGRKAAWSKVDNIGDTALFFDDHGNGFSMELTGTAGPRRGCVYFVHEKRSWVFSPYRFLCRYSMERERVEKTVVMGDTSDIWLVPSLSGSDE